MCPECAYNAARVLISQNIIILDWFCYDYIISTTQIPNIYYIDGNFYRYFKILRTDF